jgi:hypothetical protein
MAHLPPGRARRQNHHSTKLTKVPLHTHAEGGQVEPVLGGKKHPGFRVFLYIYLSKCVLMPVPKRVFELMQYLHNQLRQDL